jgi:type II secretory ATPase GspE/PulE/Tfp pilus assembly ATPase PilB-like protein
MRNTALEGGMLSLRISGAQKVAAGLTTAAEVFAVVQDEDAG